MASSTTPISARTTGAIANRPPLKELPRRAVVFAAIHAEDFERWANDRNFMLEAMLEVVDADAPRWWDVLKADELFVHLGGSAPAYNPSPEEIEPFGDRPETAWRPLEAHLDRALERGLWVTAQL